MSKHQQQTGEAEQPADTSPQTGGKRDAGDSFAVAGPAPQPHSRPTAGDPLAEVVLFQPQIPQNTGNIGRSCVATGSTLWIVHPAGFQIDEKRVRRAGLDYWQYLNLNEVDSWQQLKQRLPNKRFWFFSRFAKRTLWDADLQSGDVIVFGSETSGLPRSIMQPDASDAIRLPTAPRVRSLNLSATVAVVLYELMRRRDAAIANDQTTQ